MPDIIIFRSLVFALIEFGLAGLVLKSAKSYKFPIALILISLGGYQLGEFIFLSSGSEMALQFALFSTTLLPPLGIWVASLTKPEKLLAIAWLIIGSIFAVGYLITPGILIGTRAEFCLVKLAEAVPSTLFMILWTRYYILGLLWAIVLAIYHIIRKRGNPKFHFALIATYATFLPTSFLLVIGCKQDLGLVTSVMCALAIFAAFIMTWASIRLKA